MGDCGMEGSYQRNSKSRLFFSGEQLQGSAVIASGGLDGDVALARQLHERGNLWRCCPRSLGTAQQFLKPFHDRLLALFWRLGAFRWSATLSLVHARIISQFAEMALSGFAFGSEATLAGGSGQAVIRLTTCWTTARDVFLNPPVGWRDFHQSLAGRRVRRLRSFGERTQPVAAMASARRN
jgi:hypothetical protein